MAGYGNRTASDYVANDYTDQHSSTRLGLTSSNTPYSNPHEKHGSGTTGGAGFGNKRSSFPSTTSSSPESLAFKSSNDTGPYTNATPLGSGSTAGAGYGNKTGSFDESKDSTLGKVMEKVGHMVHNEGIVEKGRVKRGEKGFSGVE
ncbi:hypothetical protein T440DRAFT_466792 [Plenodomus tracheiphilus IPT5]|uniref:Uncharacterized protein n=1 Tax=Plenodomus tracheiphilus IPT5 TaxID=1408161 RepID=A0A6A7BEN9_9PLEO|nr:hypothetical protein T440DRAFT_466792 [Plenodomus tracheiphilus IPT5]